MQQRLRFTTHGNSLQKIELIFFETRKFLIFAFHHKVLLFLRYFASGFVISGEQLVKQKIRENV